MLFASKHVFFRSIIFLRLFHFFSLSMRSSCSFSTGLIILGVTVLSISTSCTGTDKKWFQNIAGGSSSSQAPTSGPDATLYTEASTNTASLDPALQDITLSRRNAITRAVAQCSPAIVGINVVEVQQVQVRDPFFDDPFFGMFFQQRPRTYKQEVKGLGSGYLISADGYILTNDHVAGNASKIIVTTADGEKHSAKLIGTDKTTDVALIKIEGSKNFPFLKLGSSDDVMVGEWAIAFGNPFGLFDNNAKPTVTVGVVSNIGINLYQEGHVYRNMIQTDAAISSGNSGGPLVNALGEVIGMNTIIYSTAQSGRGAGSIGIGFSVPINRVKKITEQLRKNGKIDRDFSPGFSIQQVDERTAKYLNLSKPEGIIVSEVGRGSSADKAGLEPGDLLMEIDGNKIVREDDVLIYINDSVVGQKVSITIQRSGEKKTIILLLERKR
jgi:serine protease Do